MAPLEFQIFRRIRVPRSGQVVPIIHIQLADRPEIMERRTPHPLRVSGAFKAPLKYRRMVFTPNIK